jgi:hypothetical protein
MVILDNIQRLECQLNSTIYCVPFLVHNVAFSRGTRWRGLCSAQTVTDRTVGYNAWLANHC